MMTRIIDVDANGTGSDGEDYTSYAARAVVAAGYLVNVPTLIRYPDGRVTHGNQVRVTPKGLTRLAREFQPVARAV